MVGKYANALIEDPAANFVDYRGIPGEPDSERSWFMVDQLVAECTNHHALCKAPQVGTLPSRIIELRTGVDDMIFPIVSNGRQGNYTALSYCWGGPQEIVATKDRWEKLMEGIPLQVLPKTIQDAVVVTRRLGHQYLWVDALCILQDSEQDWLSEASKMAHIYGNACVTISAAGGSDCSAGCFMKGKADTGQELGQLVLGLPNGDTGIIYLRVNNYYKPANDPLNKRGWALQERLLSPRLLIYSAGKVSWQCQTKSGTQGIGSARLPNYFFDNLLTNGYKQDWHSPSPKTDKNLFILWAQIALDYSRRDLTYESDALPALSGLARRLQDITGDEYLAGLWRESLCRWLMWHTETYIKSRPLIYLAPTWSWLSLRGPILFVHSRFDSDSSRIKILDAVTILVGPDTTGPVSAGKITLCGQVKEVQRRGNEIWEVGTGQACKVGLALLDFFAELVDAIEGPLSCLRVSEYNGLLLKPSGVDYQRVGIFISDSKGDGEDVEKYPFKDWEMCTLTLV